MRTIDAETIIKGAADLCGLDRDNISAVDFAQLRQSFDRRLATAWEFDLFPELIRTEKRYYRAIYASGTAYVVTNEVYYPSTGKYYQALTSTTGNAPANSSGVVDNVRWAESATTYAANDYAAATSYVRGDQVFYAATDRFYQLHAATSTGNAPTDTTKWGILTPFDRYVAYAQTGYTAIGTVLSVENANPRITTRSEELLWLLSDVGVQVLSPSAYAWITYKIRTPRIFGDVHLSTVTYAVGEQVYSSTGVPGNFYDVIASNLASAITDTDNFTVVDIPLIFQRYLEHGVYSDWLRNNGQSDRADDADIVADQKLYDQSQLLVGQQQQTKRTTVLTR